MSAARSLSLAALFRRFGEMRRSEDFRRKRHSGMIGGLVTSLGNRLLSIVIGFVSVPLTIHYLGTEQYGAWMTINAIRSLLLAGSAKKGLRCTIEIVEDKPA